MSVNNYMREKFGLKIIWSVTIMSDTVQVFCLWAFSSLVELPNCHRHYLITKTERL